MHDKSRDCLLAGLVQGRENAFAALHDQYARSLFRVAWTLLRSRPDAEDAVQDVFLGLYRARSSLGCVENIRAYLFAALRHAVARQTARPRLCFLPAEEAEAPDSGARGELDAETSFLLERGLAALPAEQREVLSLKIDGGLTFAEIAVVLGIRLKTAASRYRYALEKLRVTMYARNHEPRTTSIKPA